MPRPNSKNYVISSEKDIPEKYRKEVLEQLDVNENTDNIETSLIIPGKRGKIIIDENSLSNFFSNSQEFYFGHGTPRGQEVVSSILEIGLKVKRSAEAGKVTQTLRGLESTTIEFGEGTDFLFYEKQELLNNWQHLNSNNIIIVSIPQEYVLPPLPQHLSFRRDRYEPFYTGSEETGYYLRPEFIRGFYNSNTHSITLNENFYQNLTEEQKLKLFKEVKKQYIKSYAECSMINPEEIKESLPLNEIELEQLIIEWYKVQLKELRETKSFQPDMLDAELHEIAGETLMSDFNDTTCFIKEDAQQELEENRDNSEEGWSLDDWE